MSSNYLISLINRLKEEYKTYYILNQQNLNEKIEQKYEIRKADIEESKQTISKLNVIIKNYLSKYRTIEKVKEQIETEKQINKQLEEKRKKFCEFIEKGKKVLVNNIKYYNKLPEYSDKKLKTVKMSPIDLINFALRISQQNKSPMEGEFYFSKYLPGQEKKNILYNDYFLKNKNRYLYPYPNDYFGMQKTILRYNLSEKNKLLPPILESPDPRNVKNGAIIASKGKDLVFKYPEDNPPPEIKFKYSRDPNILPSFFTGEEYKDYAHPNLDRDCIIKVCTCKSGFRDSKILTLRFTITDSTTNEVLHEKEVDTKPKIDVVNRPHVYIDSKGPKIEKITASDFNSSSPLNVSRTGSSLYEPVYYNPEDEDDDDEDL